MIEATGSYWVVLAVSLHEAGFAVTRAARFNPQIKAHYERLRAGGRPPKVAQCAAARKLLHLAYAVVTQGSSDQVAGGAMDKH